MSTFQIIARRSPLEQVHNSLQAEHFSRDDGWKLVSGYASGLDLENFQVGMADVGALGKLELHGSSSKTLLESHFNIHIDGIGKSYPAENVGILALRPDKYLILCPIASEEDLLASLKQKAAEHNHFVTLINQTGGYGVIRLTGEKASLVLSKLCAIDLRSHKAANQTVVQSSMAKIHTTIARHDLGNTVSFDILVARYNAVYLWECLMDAGLEYNIQPYGWDDMGNIGNIASGTSS